ncbi:MAG: DUF5675 family protein [Bacteroidia bacterium]|nr:DUF5675 family protein [Bacteroidia bacterium]
MLDFFRKIFRFLFGGSETPSPIEEKTPPTPLPEPAPKPQAQPEPPVDIPGERENEPDLTGTFSLDLLTVTVVRFDHGPADTLGKLYINGKFQCYTLENTRSGKSLIPAGNYSVALKTSGGRHATYQYRFKELHKGILALTGVAGFESACIHIGNRVEDASGSIMTGTQVQRQTGGDFREVWFSDKAYLKIYPLISTQLEKGNPVVFTLT